MSTFAWIMGTMIVLIYILFPWYIIMQEDKRRNEIKNQPPELWRIHNWHLIDKVKIRDFLIADLKHSQTNGGTTD